jgi:ribose transport system ATP-binding protein
LSVRGVSKVFPGTRALNNVDLDVMRGEIHALVGGNGCGKSTLIKILSGVLTADGGTIRVGDVDIDATQAQPTVSHSVGIRVVHQDLAVFPDLTVAENIMLGAEYPTTRLGRIRWRELRRQAQEQIRRFEIPARAQQLLSELPVASRTQVAIARALQDVDSAGGVIILDEPTAALPVHEVQLLFAAIRRLAAAGNAVIFISHRLDEVLALTDRVTVMRDGQVVAEHRTSELTERELISSILGRLANDAVEREEVSSDGPVVLELAGLNAGPLQDVDLTIRSGEVVGIAGLLGSGRSELLRAVYGDLAVSSGDIRLNGSPVRFSRPGQAISAGVVMIPEDRVNDSVFPEMSVDENMAVSVLQRYWRMGFFRKRSLDRDAGDLRRRFRVKTPSGKVAIKSLSGGNQQKAVLARWLRRDPALLLLDEPTQGVDVGARADIYEVVREVTGAGGAAIVVTSDLEELAQVVDRAVVLHNGRVVAHVPRHKLSAQHLNELVYQGNENEND